MTRIRLILLVALLVALVFCAHTATAQSSQFPPQTAPSATQHAASPAQTPGSSPVTPTPESIARAKAIYGYDCSSCHGEAGDGKGDLAKDMALKMPDFTNPATLKDNSDKELFDIIQNGKMQMPAEGDRATTDETWNLVLYCRSFSQKSAPAQGKPAQ